MTNKNLIILVALVICCIATIFVLQLMRFAGNGESSSYINSYNVRGISAVYKTKTYTLSFDQQKKLLEMINRTLPMTSRQAPIQHPLPVDKVVIHRFTDPDIPITFVAINKDKNLVLSAPKIHSTNYLVDISQGAMLQLLENTHD